MSGELCVLAVDDDPDILATLQEYFESQSVTIHTAQNGTYPSTTSTLIHQQYRSSTPSIYLYISSYWWNGICLVSTLSSLNGFTNSDTGLLYVLPTSQSGLVTHLFPSDSTITCDVKWVFGTPLSVLLHFGLLL